MKGKGGEQTGCGMLRVWGVDLGGVICLWMGLRGWSGVVWDGVMQ